MSTAKQNGINWTTELLTPEIYDKLVDRRTSRGFTIDQCIHPGLGPHWKTGVSNPVHPFIETVGLIAGDEECYSVFADVFNPVINARHRGSDLSKPHQTHMNHDLLVDGESLDPNYVLSCRVRASRNLKGFPLTPSFSMKERKLVEKVTKDALETIESPFKGEYHSIATMPEEIKKELTKDRILFSEPASTHYIGTNMVENWPEDRGIWFNAERNFIVWVNEEDHLRVISMQKGANMKEVFGRISYGLDMIKKALERKNQSFMFDDRLGFISTCPCNIGTGLRASVHLRVPLLRMHSNFGSILESMRLQKRGQDGADSDPTSDVIDISNADKLGSTEVEQVQSVIDGVKFLVGMEKALEAGDDITKLDMFHVK